MKRTTVLWLAVGLVGTSAFGAGLVSSSNDPASCGGSTATFTNTTSIAVPAPGTITSSIVVSGAGPYLLDLNAQTFLAHSRNGHLQIALTSPAGTISSLSTNNGGSFGGVFNGTVWDDQANPGGQVPYDFNPGLVTDHPYADGVLATPLVPEEAMGAFIGEDPNGLWTLTIADDCTENPPDTCANDHGTLTAWSLEVTSLPATPASTLQRFRNIDNTDIPFGPSVTTTTLAVSGMGTYLGNLNLHTFLSYPVNQDLDVTLQSPAGTVVTITTDNGGTFADTFDNTDWFDKADPGSPIPYANDDNLVTDRFYRTFRTALALVPEEAMSAFNGENPNGLWTLTISVDAPGNRGGIDEWDLDVTTIAIPSGTCTLSCPGDVTVPAAPGQCDAKASYPPPTAGACCGAVTCTPDSGSTFPIGTTTVVCSAQSGQTCSFHVTVQDQTPPDVHVTAKSTLLWPPNHNMVNVGLSVSAADTCDTKPGIGVAVFGDEDDETPTGDGNFSPDAKNIASGTLRLRSERKGDADGRVYLIVGTATDASGNAGHECATVVVPHSQSAADINSVLAQAAAARSYCRATGMPPPSYVVVGDGPVIGPKQFVDFDKGEDPGNSIAPMDAAVD